MTQNIQTMTEQWNKYGKCKAHIGHSDLCHDSEMIEHLLKLPESQGVVMKDFDHKGQYHPIFRPTSPLLTDNDTVKTVRKFLGIIAILGGQMTLVAIKNEKDIPSRAVDFEDLHQELLQQSKLFEMGQFRSF